MPESKLPSNRPKRGVLEGISWWWNTRIKSFWSVKLNAKLNQHHANTFSFEKKAVELKAEVPHGVTAILNVYKRSEYLPQQIQALRNQSHPPAEIWLWCNSSDLELKDFSTLADRVIVSNTNWLFWGRFAQANLVRTQYVCLFDDDILPQPQWIENCLQTIADGYDGILGGSGVILPKAGGYSSKVKVGWNGHHIDQTTEVDLVGHAWFFDKKQLKYLWQEEPYSWDNGEDIHFSAMALKHGNVGTYVPPHPESEPLMWSCRPDFGKAVGRTSSATFKSEGHHNVRDAVVDHQRANGWTIVAQRNSETIDTQAPEDNNTGETFKPERKGVAQRTDTNTVNQLTSVSAELPKPPKVFAEALGNFTQRIATCQNFSLVRFGDGEMIIINGQPIDLSKKYNGEHKYTPGNPEHETQRDRLAESLSYRSPNYFVGIACPCCVGDDNFFQLKAAAQQEESQLTWANIFVNANYQTFRDETQSAIATRTVNLICHERANTSKLAFDVNRTFRVGGNSWVNDHSRVEAELLSYLANDAKENEVFLFCAGVLSNILICSLTQKYPEHTYIDVGSVFDVDLGLGKTRKYLKKGKTLKKTCEWK